MVLTTFFKADVIYDQFKWYSHHLFNIDLRFINTPDLNGTRNLILEILRSVVYNNYTNFTHFKNDNITNIM